ncbi:MAG TPA: DUF5916 domain-containing protein [Gemmatimonadaceae bacterium]|nr:DUF5916 domain-containing protein [Gemmatimonadaceae bacterium]
MLTALALIANNLLSPDAPVHNGRARELDVRPPRSDAEVVIDGVLDEPAWSSAARLTGFSRYAPDDGVPADDSTDVLVWYSPVAIHFGIRAYAQPGTVNATLADRDRIYTDDYIGIFLATFDDGKQATVFAVNPLGVQGDGIVVERGVTSGGSFSGLQNGREPTDISPDYVFESKGRITDYGFEVEIRIPLKSLRYQGAETQNWGINVLRRVQSRGLEYSWAPARRAAASYVAQFGKLHGLTGLSRGRVLDLNPFVAARATSARTVGDDFDRSRDVEPGANVRWGISNAVTLSATVNPDFAEVESDAGQIVFDPRSALFFPEKRPFFLEGIEQFATPNQLIYTRRIAEPLVAAKMTGKAGRTDFALLSAIDDNDFSVADERPIYNILRAQHELGRSSRLGLAFTSRLDGDASNNVMALDARLVWRNIYSALFQAGGSRTVGVQGEPFYGSVFLADLRRLGRTLGLRYRLNVLHDDFRASSGFIGRPSLASATLNHTLSHYGREESFLQRASIDVMLNGNWKYRDFVDGNEMLERKLHLNQNVQLRGGWEAGFSVLIETFGFDSDLYSDLFVERAVGNQVEYVPFTGDPDLGNLDYVLSLKTPNFKTFSATGQYLWGRDENFFEWTGADIHWINVALNWRPTEQLRVEGTYDAQLYLRASDGSRVGETRIPRVRVEYQLTRTMFVRVVGQYFADYADDLRESDRSNAPLFRQVGDQLIRARGFSTVDERPKEINEFRPELLFSYAPSPGTVLYAGYGGMFSERDAFQFSRDGTNGLRRQEDALFLKLSYLFRT